MKIPSIRSLAKILIAISVVSAASLAIAQEKIKINIGHITPSTSAYTQTVIGPLRDALQATGKVEVVLHGAGSPFSAPARFAELVEKGILDIAQGIPQFEPSRFPLNLVFAEPLVVDDHEKGTVAYMRLLRTVPELAKEFAPNKVMWVAVASGEQIHSRRKQIQSIEDLKGLRISATNPGVQAILREAGAAVVALPSTTNYENLQKGVIDAASSTWLNVPSFNLMEVTAAHYEIGLASPLLYMTMNQQKYDSLPPDVKKVIDNFSTDEAGLAVAKTWSKFDQDQRQAAAKAGHAVIQPTAAEREAMRKRFASLRTARLEELEKKGLPANRVLDAYLKAVAQQK